MADGNIGQSTITKIGQAVASQLAGTPLQATGTDTGTTAFGDPISAELTAEIEEVFSYSVNSRVIASQPNGSGSSISVTNAMLTASTGASAARGATAKTKRLARYHAGLGMRARFTGKFTTGAANSLQEIGMADAGQGLLFGFNGSDFGIIHRKGGQVEVQTLTISTGSSHGESITITLNSQTASVPVTNTGNTTLTANEIAAFDYANTGQGWDAVAIGSTVVFTSWNAIPKAGTYSLSGATSAVGTFAQDIAGLTPTTSFIPQADWNGADILDGSGTSGVTLVPTNGNVYQIVIPFLGYGSIKFFIKSPGGDFLLVHTIQYENTNVTPSLDNPTMPFFMRAINISNATDMSVQCSSVGVFVEGIKKTLGIDNAAENSHIFTGSSAEAPILTLVNKPIYQGELNRTIVDLNFLSVAVEHSKPVFVNVYKNATLTGASFVDIDTADSVVAKDTAATAATGGTFLFAESLGKNGNSFITFVEKLNFPQLGPGETITITGDPTSVNGAEVDVSINFSEKI